MPGTHLRPAGFVVVFSKCISTVTTGALKANMGHLQSLSAGHALVIPDIYGSQLASHNGFFQGSVWSPKHSWK